MIDFFLAPVSDLYRAHARRLEVQEDALALLAQNVERERRAIANGRLLLVLIWRFDRLLEKENELCRQAESTTPPAPACRSQESFCGDTGCEVHGLGPEGESSEAQKLGSSDLAEPRTPNPEPPPAPGGAS